MSQARAYSGPALSLVTVVYRRELGMLRLQARSLARYVAVGDIAEILIVLNDRNPADLAAQIDSWSEDYGVHKSRLRLIDPAEIFDGPNGPRDWWPVLAFGFRDLSRKLRGHPQTNWRGASGWLIQQAMKLAAGRAARGDALVFLDAKNHFIAPACAGDFFADGLAPRMRLERVQDNYFAWHARAHAFLGLPAPDRDAMLPPSITPFSMSRNVIETSIESIGQKAGALQYFFRHKTPQGTEFTLLYAQAKQDGVQILGDLLPFSSFFRDASEDDVLGILTKAESREVAMLGTHTGRLESLTATTLDRLFALWRSVELIESAVEGRALAGLEPAS